MPFVLLLLFSLSLLPSQIIGIANDCVAWWHNVDQLLVTKQQYTTTTTTTATTTTVAWWLSG